MSTNKVILHGNVGKDPEVKVLPDGKMLARFSVATTETWKNQQGEKQSKTEWHNIAAWGKQAETISKFIKKGQELIIEGKLEYTKDKEDPKRTYTNIRMISFDFCGKKGEGNNSTPDPEYVGPEYTDNTASPTNAVHDFSNDDDIPF